MNKKFNNKQIMKSNVSSRKMVRRPNRGRFLSDGSVEDFERTLHQRMSTQPQSKTLWLTYDLISEVFNNPGGAIVAEEFQSNNPYDLLTAIFTATVQFYGYNMAIYIFAKVFKVQFLLEFGNLEQNPIDIYFFATATSIASSLGSKANVQALAGSGVTLEHQTMSEQYGARSLMPLILTVVPWRTIGNRATYIASEDYAATSSGGPPKVTFCSWVAATSQPTMASGITVRVTLRLKIKFYEMRIINNPLLVASVIPFVDMLNQKLESMTRQSFPGVKEKVNPRKCPDGKTPYFGSRFYRGAMLPKVKPQS